MSAVPPEPVPEPQLMMSKAMYAWFMRCPSRKIAAARSLGEHLTGEADRQERERAAHQRITDLDAAIRADYQARRDRVLARHGYVPTTLSEEDMRRYSGHGDVHLAEPRPLPTPVLPIPAPPTPVVPVAPPVPPVPEILERPPTVEEIRALSFPSPEASDG